MKDLLIEEAQALTSITVTDTGFQTEIPEAAHDLASDSDIAALTAALDAPFIRIAFPSFADGRGFTLARRLRQMGFVGRIHAAGHVLADQYAMARRSGFDAVEIDSALAARQPEDQWRARANWRDHDHRSRLMAA